MKSMFPNRAQWKRWSLPSKLSAIGAYIGILCFILFIFDLFIFGLFPYPSKNKVKLIVEHRQADVKNAKLDLKPNIRMDITFGKNDTDQSYVVIENAGPVDVVQFEFQYTILLISTISSFTGHAAITEIGRHPKKIDRIKANDTIIFHLPVQTTSWFIDNLKLKPSSKMEHKVLEIMISYRRDSGDLKQYASRAFYYLNPNGRIVSESDNSLPKDIYRPIIEAAHKSIPIKPLKDVKINELHPIENLDD